MIQSIGVLINSSVVEYVFFGWRGFVKMTRCYSVFRSDLMPPDLSPLEASNISALYFASFFFS